MEVESVMAAWRGKGSFGYGIETDSAYGYSVMLYLSGFFRLAQELAHVAVSISPHIRTSLKIEMITEVQSPTLCRGRT